MAANFPGSRVNRWPKPSTGRPAAAPAGAGAACCFSRSSWPSVFGTGTALSYYVDALWFDSLGYVDVFWKTLNLQGAVFSVTAVTTFSILFGSYLASSRRASTS